MATGIFEFDPTAQTIQRRADSVLRALRGITVEEINDPTTEPTFRQRLSAKTPVLDYANDVREQKELPGGAIEITISIPVEDPWQLLYSKPAAHPAGRPDAQVDLTVSQFSDRPNVVVFTYRAERAVTEEFKAWREAQYDTMSGWLDGIAKHVDEWNEGVEQLLQSELGARQENLKTLAEFDLGA